MVTAAVDQRRLQRLAREPSRVFGANDERNYRWPLRRALLDGDEWYGPGFCNSLFRGGQDPVLRRALERLGHTDMPPATAALLEPWLVAECLPIVLPEPAMYALSSHTIGVYYAISDYLVPAIPVVYAQRRYGEGTWEVMPAPGGLRYRQSSGTLTAFVARVRAPEREA